MVGVYHAAQPKFVNLTAPQATMIRTVAVYPFACAYLALLPLIARHQLTHGSEVYGILLAVVSVGAVLGSLVLASIQKRLDPNIVVAAGTGGLALALVLFGLRQNILLAAAAALIAGAAWTMVLSVLYVSAQLALPDWVRGRGLSIFLTVIFGSITLGSAVWGLVAAKVGLEAALFAAAAGALLASLLSWRWKLRSAEIETLVPPVGAQPVA
jgi:predicted MFS family arabinose efflux permease